MNTMFDEYEKDVSAIKQMSKRNYGRSTPYSAWLISCRTSKLCDDIVNAVQSKRETYGLTKKIAARMRRQK